MPKMRSLDYYTNKDEYLTLSEDRMEYLKKTINFYLQRNKRTKINYKHSSYGYKHMFEKICDFYVSNIDFKEAMKQLGIPNSQYVDFYLSINVHYPISEIIVREIKNDAREAFLHRIQK